MTFQIVYEASSRAVIGSGPFDPGTDYGPEYPIVTLEDDQLDAVMGDSAYLCADGKTVKAAPC